MEKRQEFMVTQFAGLNGRLAEIKTEISCCTEDVAKLRRDNVYILGIPEGAEEPNASQFISTNLMKWFPNLGEQRMEIMQAHCVGPLATGN